MTFARQIAGPAALGAALLLGLSAPSAQAGYVVTLTQQGSNVVAVGSGTLDLAALSRIGLGLTSQATIVPSDGVITTGSVNGGEFAVYNGFSGPVSFGSGGVRAANSGMGVNVGINNFGDIITVPGGYSSGSGLSDSSIYDDATFESLGVTPGQYVWTWGSGATADSFTLDIPAAAVPEPSSVLLVLPLGLIMLLAARHRHPAQTCSAEYGERG